LNRYILFLPFFILFFSAKHAHSQSGGISSYKFINIPVSARIASMGGSFFSARDNDSNLGFYNQSLLNPSMDNQFSMSYINYFSDVAFGHAGYTRSFGDKGTFNASMQYVNYGDFLRTEPNGDITGEFFAGDYALNVGWGKSLDTSFSVGANFKTIYSVYEQYHSLAVGVDLSGTYYDYEKNFGVSLIARNIGRQIVSYRSGNNEPLPFEVHLGMSKKLDHAPFRFSFVYENLERYRLLHKDTLEKINPLTGDIERQQNYFFDNLMRHMVFGVEILPTNNFFFRLGYNYRRGQELKVSTRPGTIGFSWGFGFRISKFHLSYGRAAYHLAGASNHFTVGTNLSTFIR
jgi:hypothetical protein